MESPREARKGQRAVKTEIARADILAMPAYQLVRNERRAAARAAKQNRQVAVGPFATFTFENYDSMWLQVHEMLRAEKGGEEQIADELSAYNPLVPKGRELVATLMFEIEEPARRARELGRMGGAEEQVFFKLESESVRGVPEQDTERSTPDGRTASVHFLHFPFSDAQVRAFRSGRGDLTLEIRHPNYRHAAGIAEAVRRELAQDFA